MARISNVSPEEAIKANLATYSDARNTPYEAMQREAVAEMSEHVTNQDVVDLASGEGIAVDEFIRRGYHVTAVEINQAKLDATDSRATKVKQDFLSYLKAQPTQSIGNVFMHHTIEHYPAYEAVLQEIGRTLKKDGICLIVTPANSTVHSVHFVAFDSPEELQVPGLTTIVNEWRERETHEYWYIGRQDVEVSKPAERKRRGRTTQIKPGKR